MSCIEELKSDTVSDLPSRLAIYFNTSVLAASLLTLRKYRAIKQDDENDPGHLARKGGWRFDKAQAVREFWERYSRNEGSKEGRVIDPVEALRRLVEAQRQTHHLKSTVTFSAGRAVACVERYLLKRNYTAASAGGPMVKGMDLNQYFGAGIKPEKAPEIVEPQLEEV